MSAPQVRAARCHDPAARGFTLIELVITVAIVAILASLALPSYVDSLRRGYRSDARAAVLQAAQWMERVRTETGAFGGALPAALSASPASGDAQYAIAVTILNAGAGYRLQATPVAGRLMGSDACGALTLTQDGVRGVTGSASVDLCWTR